jgi:hypothetical protein
MTLESKIRKILKEGLVSPVLKLKETHPDHYFTEKGYETLLSNTIEEIMTLLRRGDYE